MVFRRSFSVLLMLLTSLGVAYGQGTTQTPTPNLAQWRAHHDRLVDTAQALPARASLADVLKPMMALAETRGRTGTAADETRTALVTLAFYVNGWPLAALVPESRAWPAPIRRSISLRGRGDLAQHFTVSALVAAMAGEPLANLIGLFKEIDDSRGGSGFSFSDLAADRAGTWFGRLAGASHDSARRLQQKVSSGLTEDDMMPVLTGLPDSMQDAEFTRRYGGVGAPAYNKVVAEIEQRVTALPLFQ